jgi:ADP-heptose:LPS heptosyltransferase
MGEASEQAPLSLEYPLSRHDHEVALSFLVAQGVELTAPLACVSLSAKTTVNTWPADRFAAVADHLQLHHGLKVVLTGLPTHADKEAEIVSHMTTTPVRATGYLPFSGVCALLSRCQILISLNTGISHIAAALHVPVVVLNGRDGASITPWGSPHRIVTRNLHYPRRHPDERQWAGLVPLITVAEVTDAINALLCETHAAHG